MFQRLYFDRQQLLPEEIYFEIYSFSKNKMTFPMSENEKTIKIVMDDDSCEENHKSAKELEDDKRAEKEAQQKLVSKTNKQPK